MGNKSSTIDLEAASNGATADARHSMGKRGFSETAEFLAADPDMTTVIFRRFHTAAIRNLLWLEGRVALLENHQRTLDNLACDPDHVELATKSWKGLAVLGRPKTEDLMSLPDSALREWEWELNLTTGTSEEAAAYILGSTSATSATTPKKTAATKTKVAEESRKLIKAKWETSLAINAAMKDYRECPRSPCGSSLPHGAYPESANLSAQKKLFFDTRK